jgi:hypothetical protein
MMREGDNESEATPYKKAKAATIKTMTETKLLRM